MYELIFVIPGLTDGHFRLIPPQAARINIFTKIPVLLIKINSLPLPPKLHYL